MLIKSIHVILLFFCCLNQCVSHFHRIHHAINEARDDLTDSIRHIFGPWRRNHKPKWYSEHHRPKSAPKPFEKPSVWPNTLPEIHETFDEAIVPEEASSSTMVTSTSTSTTTTTTTELAMPMMPMESNQAFPSLPNGDSMSNGKPEEFSDKPGFCSGKPTGSWICSNRCSMDADCRGEKKCCPNRCGALTCVMPEKGIDEFSG